MTHQDTAATPNLTEDQPPVYPSNDKPPDYHDVCPRKTITPPPVDIPSPNNDTVVHFPPHDDTPVVHVYPPDNATAHFPLTTTTNGISHTVHSSNTATVTTRYPPENFIITQPPTFTSHPYNVNEIIHQRDSVAKTLFKLFLVCCVFCSPIIIFVIILLTVVL